jgi:SAM-dependent methyltransferase
MNISSELQLKLLCPVTKTKLIKQGNYLFNKANSDIRYPIINDIPILINDKNSLFSIEDFKNKIDTTWNLNPSKLKSLIRKLAPGIGLNIKAKQNYKKINGILTTQSKILVVGGSIKGEGMSVLYSNDSFEVIGLDVSFGPHTKIISDAHDIPFEDETFDCVVVQAVLEHVLSPKDCVNEIHRVLKNSGIVYAETPFMQQVHMKQYDFTRFTFLGHRRLFRNFEEIEHAPLMGPGTALAWSYLHFVTSFTTSKKINFILSILVHLTSFFLKYFDYYLIDKPGSYDAASAYFFMGKKSNQTLNDRDLIKGFKGKQ